MLPFQRLVQLNTKDNLWVYILALLKDEPRYGWEIPNLIEKHFGFRPGKITPYRVFYRLETDGFVKSRQDNRKRIYVITEKGKNELGQAVRFYGGLADKINGKLQ